MQEIKELQDLITDVALKSTMANYADQGGDLDQLKGNKVAFAQFQQFCNVALVDTLCELVEAGIIGPALSDQITRNNANMVAVRMLQFLGIQAQDAAYQKDLDRSHNADGLQAEYQSRVEAARAEYHAKPRRRARRTVSK